MGSLRVVCRTMLRSVAAAAAVAVIVGTVPASSQAATLAPTPYMGWNPYYGVGGKFNESVIKSVASSLISTGLAQAGYKIVWLDFGWASGARDSNGELTVDPTQWPDGMKGMTDWLHQQGLEAGIYTDAGTSGCYGEGVGSYGHYQQDANTFAAWGFDAVKVDFCGAGQAIAAGKIDATPQQLYAEFSEALANNSSGRPMILNVCNFWTPGKVNGTYPSVAESSWGSYVWAPQIAQSWRTDTDIGFPHNVQFQWVLRNLDQDAAHPEAAGPGHWNDPDYLAPALGMTDTEAQSQFSMWAMLAAPLMLGSDPRALSQAELTMLQNRDVIAIDQDSLGAQGTVVSQSGSGQVWAKPLANGDVAVALLNRGTSPATISTTADAVGLPQAGSYTLRDLWANTTTTTTTGDISASVPAHSVTLYRVTPGTQTGGHTAALRVAMGGADSGSVSANPGPIACPGTCSARYPTGSQVTLTATPTGGATFVGWSGGGCSGTGPCTIAMSADTSVTANFAFPLPTLSVSVSGSGRVTDASGLVSCTGICSARYWGGTSVPLTATPAPGYILSGWSGGGCSGAGACTVSVTADTAVTATFVPLRTLTVSVIGAGAGTITGPKISCPGTCSASYPVGTSVTLSATPAAGSRFGAWLSGGCPAGAGSCAVTLSSDATLTAAFDLPRSGTAYVVNGAVNTVTPIALATDQRERPIRGFRAPRQIAISPDGGTGYVVNAGSDTVTPIDLATNTTERAISGFDRPGPIAVTPDGKTAYVLEGGRRLVSVDLSTDRLERVITFRNGSGVGEHAVSIAIAPNGRTAYLATFNSPRRGANGTVVAVGLRTGRVRAVIRGFAHPSAIAITPDGRTAYVTDLAHGNLTPISLATNRAVAAPTLRARRAFPGADAVAVAPDGRTVYVADARPGVAAIAAATPHQKPVELTVADPRDLALTPNAGTAYVTSGVGGGVVPIDLATETERPVVTRFRQPSAIAIAIPPPTNDTVRLATPPRSERGAVRDRVRCLSPTTDCRTIEMLSVGTTVLGRTVATLRPRRTVSLRIALDSHGRQLLGRRGSLPVILSVAIRRGDHVDTVTTRTVRLKG